MLGHGFFHSVCEATPWLQSLRLSNCEVHFVSQSWSHVLRYISSRLKQLETLSFSHCNLLYTEVDGIELSGSDEPHANLKHLKLFDTTESRPDASVAHRILYTFPALVSLRADVCADVFPATDKHFLSLIQKVFNNLRRLELRFGKYGGSPEKTRVAEDVPIEMPNLTNLSVWCSRKWPSFLLTNNLQTITTLYLYCVSAPPPGTRYCLPNLKVLSIQMVIRN
jgi:hypothetical protein